MANRIIARRDASCLRVHHQECEVAPRLLVITALPTMNSAVAGAKWRSGKLAPTATADRCPEVGIATRMPQLIGSEPDCLCHARLPFSKPSSFIWIARVEVRPLALAQTNRSSSLGPRTCRELRLLTRTASSRPNAASPSTGASFSSPMADMDKPWSPFSVLQTKCQPAPRRRVLCICRALCIGGHQDMETGKKSRRQHFPIHK